MPVLIASKVETLGLLGLLGQIDLHVWSTRPQRYPVQKWVFDISEDDLYDHYISATYRHAHEPTHVRTHTCISKIHVIGHSCQTFFVLTVPE